MLIRVYQRQIAGRGPLRDVACTFTHTESCSAYGLRVTEEGRDPRLIRNRLRRCRRASLYRLSRDGRVGWGELLDRPVEEIERELSEAGEGPASRALVLRAAAVVADQCADHDAAKDLLRRAAVLSPARSKLLARDGALVVARSRRLAIWRAAAGVVGAVVLVCLLITATIAGTIVVGLAVAALGVWVPIRKHVRLASRLEGQGAVTQFESPARLVF